MAFMALIKKCVVSGGDKSYCNRRMWFPSGVCNTIKLGEQKKEVGNCLSCGEQLAAVPGNFLGCVLSCRMQLLLKHHQFVWLWMGERVTCE